jgi:Domain of unknown function (DUF1707)
MSTSTSTSTSAPPSSLRASDTEREATVARLHRALGAGLLDLDETDERVTAAYAARHRCELEPLVADLPQHSTAATAAPSWAEVWTSAVWRGRGTLLGGVPEEPTARQCRTAALLAVLVLLWLIACALIGAAL